MCRILKEDIQTVFAKDPAATNVAEVILFYPGLHALWAHRWAHFLWEHKLRFLGHWVSHCSRFYTGIEIHPGAKIGRRFFIDHGAGVVIGETAEIGDDVLIYQGVTLGGTTLEKKKRHPTVGNNVVMGTGSVALGPITIGDGARIGSGSVVVKSVPPGATVVGIPGRVVTDGHEPLKALEHGRLPDPVAEAIRLVLKEQRRLEDRLEKLETSSGVSAPQDEMALTREQIEKEFYQGAGI
ncbi:MAG: serine O-acetyltransferase [Dehalococcoidales bacterium]|nr:serine O-acetyltransferase [Dehalococcoidales bacterium]